jgi:hypothetical protein
MSRYYFHIRDGRHFVPDEEGIECRNLLAVEVEAQASARDMVHQALPRRVPAIIEIEDDEGNAVVSVSGNYAIN